ncbi:MAG: peptidoglycan-binding protein [Lachnospiraceae bacterium]|nr:peptidoglycan-binding protein [Lachnospiraceae bacterium]
MNKLNYNCGTPDGTFGSGTETALKNFQKAHSLTDDGLAGSSTLAAIKKAVNNLDNPSTPAKGLSENRMF